MLSRLRHPLAAAAAAAFLIPALAACGGEQQVGLGDKTADGFDAVSISGDQGKAPEVKWKAAMEVDQTDEKTLVEGKGGKITGDDKADVYLYIGNGTTKSDAYSDWDNGQPMELAASGDSVSKVFSDMLDGATIGSRVAAVTPAAEVFGEAGNAQLGVGNADSLLVIMDVMDKAVPPKPVDVPASQMPKLVEKGGKPTSFDFAGIPKPKVDGDLQRTVLKKGNGPVAKPTSQVEANYLGQVYRGDKPFDETYSKGQPAPFGLDGVIEGWTYGLSGLKQGSRVLLAVPPRYGYGDAGKPEANIKGDDTLYFVVDLVKVK